MQCKLALWKHLQNGVILCPRNEQTVLQWTACARCKGPWEGLPSSKGHRFFRHQNEVKVDMIGRDGGMQQCRFLQGRQTVTAWTEVTFVQLDTGHLILFHHPQLQLPPGMHPQAHTADVWLLSQAVELSCCEVCRWHSSVAHRQEVTEGPMQSKQPLHQCKEDRGGDCRLRLAPLPFPFASEEQLSNSWGCTSQITSPRASTPPALWRRPTNTCTF